MRTIHLLLPALLLCIGADAFAQGTTAGTGRQKGIQLNSRPQLRLSDERALKPRWLNLRQYSPPPVRRAGDDDPLSPEAARLLNEAAALAHEGKHQEALARLREAERIEPRRLEVHFLRGLIFLDLEKPDEAAGAFERAASLAPDRAEVRSALCAALDAAERRTEAIAECRRAVDLAPETAAYKTQLAALYVSADRLGEAVELLNVAMRADEASPAILGPAGDAYFRMGDYARAAEIYERIASSWPSVKLVYARLARVYDYLGRSRDALAAARKYAEASPASAYSHFILGDLLQNAGLFDESIPALLKATELDPADGAGYEALSRSYEALGDKDNTLGSLRHAYKYLPPDARLAYRLGAALTG